MTLEFSSSRWKVEAFCAFEEQGFSTAINLLPAAAMADVDRR